MLSVMSNDVCVAFYFEVSMLYGRWHDKKVRVNYKRGMVMVCFV